MVDNKEVEDNGGELELVMEEKMVELKTKIDPSKWYTIRNVEKVFGDDISSVWLRRVITAKDDEGNPIGPFYMSRKKVAKKNKRIWNVLGKDILVHGKYLFSKELRRQERLAGKNKYYYITPSKYVYKKMMAEIDDDDQITPEEKEIMIRIMKRYKVVWENEYKVRMKKREDNKKKKNS